MVPESTLLGEGDRERLLEVARRSIGGGLDGRGPLSVDLLQYPEDLRAPRAAFVTLLHDEDLRGCVGTLEASRPTVENVARYAHTAAFSDTRFPPLESDELPGLWIEISLLSALEEIPFASEEDLVLQLRPGIDGLLIEEDCHRGTFLPTVWESFPEPRKFLERLKLKAGLEAAYWSPSVRVCRYTTLGFGGPAIPHPATFPG